MKVKEIVDVDYGNYKKAAMFIGTTACSGKCWKELGADSSMCQNDKLHDAPVVDIPDSTIISRYLDNPLSKSIVFGGLEPLDTLDELYSLVEEFRKVSKDDVVIYTGYNSYEKDNEIFKLCELGNIVFKFGRYNPNLKPRFDDVLGVELASNNQYGITSDTILDLFNHTIEEHCKQTTRSMFRNVLYILDIKHQCTVLCTQFRYDFDPAEVKTNKEVVVECEIKKID